MHGVKVSSVGCYVPPKVLTNEDLERLVETSDEWIMTRVGIKERHIAEANVATSDLAIEAVHAALSNIGASAQDVEAIIVRSEEHTSELQSH